MNYLCGFKIKLAGAVKVYNMLKEANNPVVERQILKAKNTAKLEGDAEWLDNILMLIEKAKIV